jgi:hypothetical protein
MSVCPGGRAGEIADRNGQRPHKPTTSTFTALIVLDGDVWSCPKVVSNVTLLAASVPSLRA